MSATVRCYTHSGMQALPINSTAGAMLTNGQYMLKQPYLYGEVLIASTGASVESTPDTLAPATNQHIKVLHIQVQPGKRVHYEVTPHGRTVRLATVASPIMLDGTVAEFGPGWSVSVLEAASDA